MLHREHGNARCRMRRQPDHARPTFAWTPVAAAVLALCAHSGTAFAIEAAAPAEGQTTGASTLPDVTVTALPDREPSVTKLPQALKDIPQSVTLIDQTRMEAQNLRTLDEVMQQSPGVTVQPYQQLTTGYYARGFKIDAFEQDGVPILMGNTASPPQDMSMYERVEIVRGATGLLHGTGNPAATVNLVPKRPQRTFAANASLGAGSWDRYRAEADIGVPANPSCNRGSPE